MTACPPRPTASPRSRLRARLRPPAGALLAVALMAAALPAAAGEPLSALVAGRIDGDRSGVCVQAASIDLGRQPPVATAAACARPRSDAPAADARFEIGSISKTFVGVLALEMVARGELKLDEPLAALLPAGTLPAGTAAPSFDGRPIRLADLLTHTAGLPALPPRMRPASPADPYADLTADVVYGSLAGLKLAAAPGTRYAYSNWAFLMLSDLLARRAGRPFDALLAERVLAPLGMNDTVVARNERLTAGHRASGDATPAWNVPVAYAGAGGIRSTLADMTIYARALLGDLPAAAPATLRGALRDAPAALRSMNERIDVGAAWHALKRPDRGPLIYHSGMTGGFAASLVFDVDARRAAVVLADAATGFEDLAARLVDDQAPLAARRRAVPLDAAAARNALGRYQLAPGFILTLTLDDGRLYAQATGQGRFELLQDSHGDYYATVADILIRMRRDAGGRATALTLYQGGGAMPAARLDD